MEIGTTFTVAASPDDTYALLLDLERVGPCVPGATIGAAEADGSHPAEIAVKLGPMRLTYAGTVRVLEQDAAARTARLRAELRERRGQGSARADMVMEVAVDGAQARVDATTTVDLRGRAAQMGRGIIDDVAGRLMDDMASCLGRRLASAPAAAPAPAPARPVGGLGLVLAALWRRVRRTLTRHGRARS